MTDKLYPPFNARLVDDNGRISKEWMPFIEELYMMLKDIKTGTEGNYVSISDLKRLEDRGVEVP